MRIFKHKESVNFIDENDVFLGYSLDNSCCSHSAFELTWDKAGKKKINFSNFDEINEIIKGYEFDTKYMDKHFDEKDNSYGFAVFRMTRKGASNIYVVLKNHHNGNYWNGFELSKIEISGYKEEIYSGGLDSFLKNEALKVTSYFASHI